MPLSTIKNVLHLEAEFLIALDVAATLADAGVANVIHATTCAQALSLLAEEPIDAAILDVEAADGSTEPVAQRLKEMGIPFVMHTAAAHVAGAQSERSALLMKPVTTPDLVETMKAALRRTDA